MSHTSSRPSLLPESRAGNQDPLRDAFGVDQEYIRRCGRTLFRLLSDFYWRIETQGLEHIPRQGSAVLVGTHRGFMPWDAIMTLHLLVRETGRFPRFLTHPGLFKFRPLGRIFSKLGGVLANQENAGRLLQNGQLVGIYPEGVQGAFALHRNAYQMQASWRNTFAKVALRHRAPIIPFVNVGSADSLPVFAHIKSRAWRRFSLWPWIPVSTFPFIPIPLPSKWRLRFLPPIHVERQYPPEAADNAALVRSIAGDVKFAMQDTMESMVRTRRSIFF